MKDTKDRLEYILKTTNETYNSLGNKIGLKTNQILYDIKNGKIKNFSYDVAKAIQTAYPSFNLEWILKGEGEKYNENVGFILGENPNIVREKRFQYERTHLPEADAEDVLAQRESEIEWLNRLITEKDERIKAHYKHIQDKDRIIEKTETIVKDKEEIIDLLKQQLANKSSRANKNTGSDVGTV